MKRYAIIVVAILLVFGSFFISGYKPVEPKRDFYIVELTDYTGGSQISSMLLENQHETFVANLAKNYPEIGVNAEYKTLLSGFSLQLTPEEAKDISLQGEVKSVVKGRIFYPHMFNTVVSTKADQAWNMKDLTGKNLEGNGVLVGIIDTGINYDHPSLGNGFENADSKVVKGYDFADLDADPMPVEGHQGWHGTHCAGIVAANGLPGIARNDPTIKGMAPAAKLGAYKVFGPVGGARTDRIMQALERAYSDGCKVVSMSLGSTYVWADEIYCRLIDKLTDKGVVCAVSAGNDGGGSRDDLPFQVGSPGGADSAICVAAMDDTAKPIVTWGSQKEFMNYLGGSPAIESEMNAQLIDALSGYPDDVKNLDLTGKIALVKRGDKYFSDKALQVQGKGAIACIIYNNEPGGFDGYLVDPVKIPVFGISDAAGKSLLEYAGSGANANISEKKYMGVMADFSSAGPTNDYRLKPDVSAPGVNVLSSVGGSAYVAMSGTSMSCPAVAGASALVVQGHPEWSAHDVRSAIINYADPQSDLSGKPWSIHSQGTGRINVLSSLGAPALFKPTSLNFGKITGSTNFKLSIKNTTGKPVKMNVSVYSEDGIVTGDVNPIEIPTKKTIDYTGTLKVSSQDGLVHVGYVVFDGGTFKARVGFLLLTNDPPVPKTIDHISLMTPVFSPNGDRKLDRFVGQFSVNKMLDGFEWALLDENDNLFAILDYSYGLQGGGYWFLTWDGIVEGEPIPAGKYKMAVYTLDRGKDPRIQANWEQWGPLEFYCVDEPPELEIDDVPESVFNQKDITITGAVKDWLADPDYLGAKAFTLLSVNANGNKINFTLDDKGAFSIKVPLNPGDNSIAITAIDAGMIKAERKVTVSSLKRNDITVVAGQIRVNNQPLDFGKIKSVNGDWMVDLEKLNQICPELSLNLDNDIIDILVDDLHAKLKIGKDIVLSDKGGSSFCEPPYIENKVCYVPMYAVLSALGGQFGPEGVFSFVWRGK